MAFRAFRVEQADGTFKRSVVTREVDELPPGDVLIEVHYSSLNYKDALSATGNPGVTRQFPHTPGIDAAGIVRACPGGQFAEGDEVIVIGFDLGMNTPGGFGQYIRVPAGWVLRLPHGLSLMESMLLGTAGFTAALSLHKLEAVGIAKDNGPILVTGATGGVGSVAVRLLADQGYTVAAVSGKPERYDWLASLGASEILTRDEALAEVKRPLLKERWGGVIDTVGGDILVNALKSLRYGCSLAACGLVASPQLASATVLPFILRHVNLLGIDSVELPLEQKAVVWNRLATEWKVDLSMLRHDLTLDTLSAAIDTIFEGAMVGRGLVDLRA